MQSAGIYDFEYLPGRKTFNYGCLVRTNRGACSASLAHCGINQDFFIFRIKASCAVGAGFDTLLAQTAQAVTDYCRYFSRRQSVS